jgi:hypothetical protein
MDQPGILYREDVQIFSGFAELDIIHNVHLMGKKSRKKQGDNAHDYD